MFLKKTLLSLFRWKQVRTRQVMSYQASRHHKGGTKSVSCHLCCTESHLCPPPTSITQPPCPLIHVKQVQCLAHIGLQWADRK